MTWEELLEAANGLPGCWSAELAGIWPEGDELRAAGAVTLAVYATPASNDWWRVDVTAIQADGLARSNLVAVYVTFDCAMAAIAELTAEIYEC